MRPKVHIYQGVISTGILYPFIGKKAFIFGASVILIDLDHVIDYYWYTGKLGIKGFFKYYEFIVDNMDNFLGLNVFHTVECYVILLLSGFFFGDLHFVLMGFLFHHLFDQIQLTLWKKPFARAFSIIEFIIRKPHYETSIHDILLRKKMKNKRWQLYILIPLSLNFYPLILTKSHIFNQYPLREKK